MFCRLPLFKPRCTRARISRRNCSSGKTTEEKSAEVSKEAWPTLRKYSPVWIPALLTIAVTVDVINNANHRRSIESVVPPYIAFVRQYIGFDDEDTAEIQRVKDTLATQREPVSARIELSSGTVIIENSVDGSVPYSEFFKNIQLKYASEGRIERITFLDDDMEEKESSESLLANYKNHKEQSIPSDREYIVAPMIESPLARTLWEAPLRDYAKSSQSSDRTFGGKKSDDSVKGSSQSKRTWSTAASIFQKSDDDKGPLNKTMIITRCENAVKTLLSDWKHFQAIQNHNILVVGRDLDDSQGSVKGSGPAGRAPAASKMSKLMQLDLAKMAVAELEDKVVRLKAEKRLGVREIDSIDSDIKEATNEITQLRRKYLNTFYYF